MNAPNLKIQERTNQFAKLQFQSTDIDNTTSTSKNDSMITQCMEADFRAPFPRWWDVATYLNSSLPASSSNETRLIDFTPTNLTVKPHTQIDTSK